MPFTYKDRIYSSLCASDTINDGLGFEVYDITDTLKELVVEIFCSDVDGQMTFSAFKPDLPLELIVWSIHQARERLSHITQRHMQ